jgi:hypothetical protein
MAIAKNLQNENTRPINSVDLAYTQQIGVILVGIYENQYFFLFSIGRENQEILRKILGQYQDYFLKLIELCFFKNSFGSNS